MSHWLSHSIRQSRHLFAAVICLLCILACFRVMPRFSAVALTLSAFVIVAVVLPRNLLQHTLPLPGARADSAADCEPAETCFEASSTCCNVYCSSDGSSFLMASFAAANSSDIFIFRSGSGQHIILQRYFPTVSYSPLPCTVITIGSETLCVPFVLSLHHSFDLAWPAHFLGMDQSRSPFCKWFQTYLPKLSEAFLYSTVGCVSFGIRMEITIRHHDHR